MKKNTAGFILVTVLMFIQIFMVISMAGYTALKYELKKTNQRITQENLLDNSEIILKLLEENIDTEIGQCLIMPTSILTFQHANLDWWQQNTCSGKFQEIRYYYAIESLGMDECAEMIDTSQQKRNAAYYRISLHILPEVILQTSIAIPSNSNQLCLGTPHLVSVGRQMWRRL